jgi:hypothetical protein
MSASRPEWAASIAAQGQNLCPTRTSGSIQCRRVWFHGARRKTGNEIAKAIAVTERDTKPMNPSKQRKNAGQGLPRTNRVRAVGLFFVILYTTFAAIQSCEIKRANELQGDRSFCLD